MTPNEIRLRVAIERLLGCSYRTDRGEEIKGNAISALSSDLRDAGWRGVSNLNDLESTVEALGFKMVRAQMASGGWKKDGRFARVVTFGPRPFPVLTARPVSGFKGA